MEPKKKRQVALLIALLALLFLINYQTLNTTVQNYFSDDEIGIVERIVDGDTIIVNSTSVRLLGINCPEKGEQYYEEAKQYLEDLILNQTVKLEFGKEKYDLYNRKLAYVYFENQNINLQLVEKGFANYYFPSGKDVYYKQFQEAWEQCINNNLNLCEASNNKCIVLKEFDYSDEIVILENICSSSHVLTGWDLKDEGRKHFTFPNFTLEPNTQVEIKTGEGIDTKSILYWKGEKYVWTKTGDTLFLRDNKNKLVLWKNY